MYQSKAHLISLWTWENNSFFLFPFSRWRGGVRENVICFVILRLPDIPKNIPVFWKLFLQHLKTEIIAGQEGRREARRTNRLNGISYMIRLLCWFYLKNRRNTISGRFVEASRLLNTSVPCHHLLFPSSPPHLPPVNRLSIRLPPRISVKLRKLLTTSILRYPVRRGPEESEEENCCGWATDKRLIYPIRFFWWWIIYKPGFFKMAGGIW